MPEQVINISVPIKESRAEFVAGLLYLSAHYFYKKGKLSLGKAAELAGVHKIDFIKKMQDENERIFDYSDDEINEIFDDLGNIN